MSVAKRFSIREIADRSGVSVSALRYYEDRGLLTSERNAAGQRTYAVDALRRVAFITVGSSLGMSLADIEHALAGLPHNRVPTKRDWERVATAWRAELDRRVHAIEIMRERLTACIGCGCLSLRDCSLTNRRDRAAARGTGPRYLLGDTPDDPATLRNGTRTGSINPTQQRPPEPEPSGHVSYQLSASALWPDATGPNVS